MKGNRLIKISLGLMLGIVMGGALYQWFSEQVDRESIPGELISVGDYKFHLLCKGQGSPLVLLENGLWGSYPDWVYIMDGVSKMTKVCSYDRLGIGWSSKNDKPTRASDVVKNLHGLLQVAGLDEPIVLVGFSAGGLYVREYYNQFPEKVVGMMLLDSAHEQQAFRIEHVSKDLSLEKFCRAIAWTGVGRAFNLFGDYVDKSFSADLHEEQLRAYNRTGFCSGLILQSQGFVQDLFVGKTPNRLGELPLVVIRAGKPIREQALNDSVPDSFLNEHEKVWPQLQEELSELSTIAKYLVAKNSGHAIQLEQPKIVIEELARMLGEVSSDGES